MPKKVKTTEKPESIKKITKRLVGVASRNSRDLSVLVNISYTKIHPLYKKRYSASKKILAHTLEEVKKGEVVTIQEARPFSKKKAWQVIKTTRK